MHMRMIGILAVCAAASGAAATVQFSGAGGSIYWQGVIGGGADVLQWNEVRPFSVPAGPAFPASIGDTFSSGFFNDGDVNLVPFATGVTQSTSVTAVTRANGTDGFILDIESRVSAVVNIDVGPTSIGQGVSASIDYVFTVDVSTPFSLVYTGRHEAFGNILSLRQVGVGGYIVTTLFDPAGMVSGNVSGMLDPGSYFITVNHGAPTGGGVEFYTDLTLTVGTVPAPGVVALWGAAGIVASRRRR